jgi:hypothetical protein
MSYFDDRIFKIVFTYGEGQQLTLDGGLDIKATGMKYANALQNECNLKIANLKKETRDHLATQLTPWNLNQQRKSVSVYAGRESTGLFLLYQGDITECTPSQPPDIILNIKSKAMQWYKFDYLKQAQNVQAPLSHIVDGVGQSLGVPVNFQATDKTINNYSYSGPALGQIDKINAMGGLDAYEDNGTLIVKNKGISLENVSHTLSSDTGMIGIPAPTEYGVQAKMLLSPSISLGGNLSLISEANPLILNGDYNIYQLGFEIASRDTAFYGVAYASRFPIIYGIANTAS